MSRIADGEYVLAAKYADGDPGDHWAVGFLRRRMKNYDPVRFDVVDGHGVSFRGNGFRRIRRITEAAGRAMVANAASIESGSWSVWKWKRYFEAGGNR